MTARILIVDDEPPLVRGLSYALRREGFEIDVADNGLDAVKTALSSPVDLVVLDVGLPELDGLEACRRIRAASGVPVIMLTARDAERDVLDGLGAGADDYLTKPFSFAELVARLNALVRRAQAQAPGTKLSYAGLTLDLASRRVERDGLPVVLQPKELALLEYFLRNPGRVLSKTMILQHIWDYAFDPQTNVVDVLVSRLRGKLDRGFDKPLIKTLRGVGYVLRDD
jgi:DNA-binding response OmpR family regulator